MRYLNNIKFTKNVPRLIKTNPVWLNLYPKDNNHPIIAANILVLSDGR